MGVNWRSSARKVGPERMHVKVWKQNTLVSDAGAGGCEEAVDGKKIQYEMFMSVQGK